MDLQRHVYYTKSIVMTMSSIVYPCRLDLLSFGYATFFNSALSRYPDFTSVSGTLLVHHHKVVFKPVVTAHCDSAVSSVVIDRCLLREMTLSSYTIC